MPDHRSSLWLKIDDILVIKKVFYAGLVWHNTVRVFVQCTTCTVSEMKKKKKKKKWITTIWISEWDDYVYNNSNKKWKMKYIICMHVPLNYVCVWSSTFAQISNKKLNRKNTEKEMTRARESKGVKYNEQYMIVMAGIARECAYFSFLLIQH